MRGSCSRPTRRRASPSCSRRTVATWRRSIRLREAPPPGAVALIERSLNGGFAGGPDGLVFVTDRELFGTVRVRRPRALRRVVPRDILERLTPGDLVVHIDHGIARYERMLRRGAAGEERDYLELAFDGTDRIYVPVEQIARISRYAGAEKPSLSPARRPRLAEDQGTRQEGRHRPRDGAARPCTRRATTPTATRSRPTRPWQQEMEASFPYEETVDQLRATAEAKADMESGRPMDRLVVGDVGYGKTEVALRAAFKAIQDGKQVAVLVPTTVLAAQHFQTFSQRYAAFPLTVRLLSRFVRAKEQAATIAGLCGRFGGPRDRDAPAALEGRPVPRPRSGRRGRGAAVRRRRQGAPEAAPQRGRRPDALGDAHSADAEPGAGRRSRPVSVIETPPEDRLPIQTRVAEASAGLVRDAILRELDRGGQVFFVHNRVETIEAQADQLREMLPGARFVVGHGQMPEGELEKVMIAFASGEADVLVCTTIIESGLDIPNANTIIIDRADTLGLAQLYQLRGRVGRSSRRAYAYLLYRRRERLSDEARKRLQAIFNASELGAGFQIALSDLEIRGAGNILGAEQSGHMAAVGFDLYSRLLAEAVEEQKATYEHRAPVHREAVGRDRPARRRPPARRATCPTRPRSWSSTGGWHGPGRRATSPRSARRSSTGSGRCRRRCSASSRWPSCGSPRRRPASRRSRARKASSSCASGRLPRSVAMRALAGVAAARACRRPVRSRSCRTRSGSGCRAIRASRGP